MKLSGDAFKCISIFSKISLSLMEMPNPTPRDHNRAKGLHEAKKELNRLVRGMEKRMNRRIATFPHGEYVLLTRCQVVDGRSGVASEHVRVVGTGVLRDAVEDHAETLLAYTGDPVPAVDDPPLAVDADCAEAMSYMDMPENAVERSKKLRVMLQRAWVLEGHVPITKHIYKAVKKGSPGFAWWHEEFPDVEFTNVAVEAADVSRKIYPVVATKLHELLTGRLPGEDAPVVDEPPHVPAEPDGPFQPCLRSTLCTRRNRHRGRCNKRGRLRQEMVVPEPVEPLEDPMEDHTEDPVEDPVEDPHEDPHEDHTQEPIEDHAEDHTEDHAREPMEDPVEDPIEEPPVDVFMSFMARLEALAHPDEPFVHLTRGQLAIVKAYMDTNISRVDAYKAMGLTVTPEYEEWARKSHGVKAWRQMAVEFPGYMETLVNGGLATDRWATHPKPKTPKQKKKAPHTTKKKAITKETANQKMRTRKRNENSALAKGRALRSAGYVMF